MTNDATTPAPAGFIARARGVLTHPIAEWRSISAEETSVARLFGGYACILLAIPTVATAIRLLVFSRAGPAGVLFVTILSYGLALLSVLIEGWLFNALAPAFGGRRDLVQAMKLAVYPQTAACLAGALDVFPFTSILVSACGLYGAYVLWHGLARLMKVPADRAVGYFMASVGSAVAVNIGLAVASFFVTKSVLIGLALAGAR